MIVGELQFAARAQHAVRFGAADIALGQGEIGARNEGAGKGKHRFEPGARVGRATDDVEQFAGAGIDLADLELVGIGMLFGADDLRHDEFFECLALILDALDFEADSGQRDGDFIAGSSGLKMLLEPVEGEFHRYMLSVDSTYSRRPESSKSLASTLTKPRASSIALWECSIWPYHSGGTRCMPHFR